MAMLVPPAIEAGSIAAQEQPVLAAGVDVELRPWRAADVPFALEAFADAGIQRWHLSSMDSVAEAEAWIAGPALARPARISPRTTDPPRQNGRCLGASPGGRRP